MHRRAATRERNGNGTRYLPRPSSLEKERCRATQAGGWTMRARPWRKEAQQAPHEPTQSMIRRPRLGALASNTAAPLQERSSRFIRRLGGRPRWAEGCGRGGGAEGAICSCVPNDHRPPAQRSNANANAMRSWARPACHPSPFSLPTSKCKLQIRSLEPGCTVPEPRARSGGGRVGWVDGQACLSNAE